MKTSQYITRIHNKENADKLHNNNKVLIANNLLFSESTSVLLSRTENVTAASNSSSYLD
jgi:hypothetical protein